MDHDLVSEFIKIIYLQLEGFNNVCIVSCVIAVKEKHFDKKTESSLRIICFEKGRGCGGLFKYFHIKRIGVPLDMATLTSTHPSYEDKTRRRTITFTTISN